MSEIRESTVINRGAYGLSSLLLAMAFVVSGLPGSAIADVRESVEHSLVEILNLEYDDQKEKLTDQATGVGVAFEKPGSTDDMRTDTLILTTAQALGRSSDLGSVRIRHGGKTYLSRVSYLDPDADIAILQVDNLVLKRTLVRLQPSIRERERVHVIGLSGLGNVAGDVVVAKTYPSNPVSMFQTTAAVSFPSGTPLFDESGRLVGITTLRLRVATSGSEKKPHLVISASEFQKADEIWKAAYYLTSHRIFIDSLSKPQLALVNSTLLLMDWLRQVHGPSKQLNYRRVLNIRQTDTYKQKEKNFLEAHQWALAQERPIFMEFLAGQGLPFAEGKGSVGRRAVSLACVVSSPDSDRGLLVTIAFSEVDRVFSFQGRAAKSVEFSNAFIKAYEEDGTVHTVSRSSGRFSVHVKEGVLFAGECDLASDKKF